MYERIKSLFDCTRNRYILIGSIVCVTLLCIGYIFYQPSGTDYHRAVDAVERAQEQQRESLELNRSIQRSIDRSADLSREAGARIDRSSQYNQQIGERISQSQSGLSEARSYLERNAEIIRRIEEQNRAGQPHNQATTNATQLIPGSGSGSDNRSGNSSIER
uniref:Type II secretion system, protein M n=1 Tax=Caudovirales sp. ctqI92 TaxID=2826785 RepID=A0A8S5MQK6_9CAUD|nr:MAG TPA: Type II secretion system, protein M [Caudovirales sp. ctqI92]